MKTRLHKKLGRLLRRRIRGSVLSRFGEGILANTQNGLFVVEAGDFAVGRKLLNRGQYDLEEINWLSTMLDESADVVVVGSHIGAVLVPLSKHCRQITAFEADADNYRLLGYNLLLNQCGNVDARHQAVGERAGSIRITRNLINTGNTSVAADQSASGAETYEVEMVALDDVVGPEPVRLMIMDIEGYEPQALAGAEDVLRRTENLYIEFAPEQLAEFGHDPVAHLERLFEAYPSMIHFAGDIARYDRDSGLNWLTSVMYRRGFLANLLFTRRAGD